MAKGCRIRDKVFVVLVSGRMTGARDEAGRFDEGIARLHRYRAVYGTSNVWS